MINIKKGAPGEARTHNLRISPLLSYKYGALTDCATGATCVSKQLLFLNQMLYEERVFDIIAM